MNNNLRNYADKVKGLLSKGIILIVIQVAIHQYAQINMERHFIAFTDRSISWKKRNLLDNPLVLGF